MFFLPRDVHSTWRWDGSLVAWSKLEVIEKIYPARRSLLMPCRMWLGPAFLMLAIVTVPASIGCFRRRNWGWRLAVAIFSVNGLSDVAQIFMALRYPLQPRYDSSRTLRLPVKTKPLLP